MMRGEEDDEDEGVAEDGRRKPVYSIMDAPREA